MNKIILTNIFLLFSYLSNAQTVTWSKYFDPSVDGELMNYLVKSDSGYLLGTDIFCTGSSWNSCLYLAKLDNLGNVTNSEYFNKSEDLAAIGICNGPKDEFKKGEKRLMCLGKKYLDDPKYYPVACFLDDSLKIIKWEFYQSQDTTQHIQISNMFSYDSFSVMVTTSIRNKFDPNEVKPVLVIIDDTLGQVAQHKVKGLEEYRLLDNPYFVKLKDGDIVCSSNIYKYGDNISSGDLHHLVFRFDTTGNLIWKKLFTDVYFGYTNFYQTDIIELNDGNLVFGGARISSNEELQTGKFANSFYYVQCVTNQGDSIWRLEFPLKMYQKFGITLQPLPNGDFIGGGHRYCACYPDGGTGFAGWLFCMSADGKMKWERYYANQNKTSSPANLFRKLVVCDDGGILVGTEGGENDQATGGLWLLKLDSMGCLTPDCSGSILFTAVNEEKGDWQDLKEVFFSIYPNPVKDVLNIDFFSPQPGRNMEIMVSDMQGISLHQSELANTKHIRQIDVSGYKPGSYVISLLMNSKVVQSEVVVKD